MSLISNIPPEALAEAWEIMERRRKEELSKKMGRPVGTWGGKRKGAGKPRTLTYNTVAKLELNSVQKKVLTEMGNGILDAGIEKLINEHM
jgi:predicted ArsR family transcriptional regulator